MRTWMIVLTAAALAGCAGGADRVDATGPTVSYDVDNQYEYEQAVERADDYCAERYGGDARLIGTAEGVYSGDDTVTFECTGD